MSKGWIKLYRKLLYWQWYDHPNTFRLFLHLLLKASYEQGNWHGYEISPGQIITGRKKLTKELHLTEQEIRTSLSHLKHTHEIVIQATNRFSIITICNWAAYQNSENTEQPTEQPTDNQQSTSNQPQLKNNKNKKSIEDSTQTPFSPPTFEEFVKYFLDHGYSSETAKTTYDGYDVAGWHDSKGNQIKNWKQKCQHVWFKPENKQPDKEKSRKPEYKPKIPVI